MESSIVTVGLDFDVTINNGAVAAKNKRNKVTTLKKLFASKRRRSSLGDITNKNQAPISDERKKLRIEQIKKHSISEETEENLTQCERNVKQNVQIRKKSLAVPTISQDEAIPKKKEDYSVKIYKIKDKKESEHQIKHENEPTIYVAKEKRISKIPKLTLMNPIEYPPRYLEPSIKVKDEGNKELKKEVESLSRSNSGILSEFDQIYNDSMTGHAHISDILINLQNAEQRYILPSNYLAVGHNQKVKPFMRSLMVDWLIQIKRHLSLLDHTLHLCITIIDLVLSSLKIPLDKLQLIGVTSLFLACKIHERYAPAVSVLLHLTDNSYVYDQVIAMEKVILTNRDFCFSIPTVIDFKDYYVKISLMDCVDDNLNNICSYLLDLCLIDKSIVAYEPSMRVAAAICLVRKLRRYEITKNRTKAILFPVWSRFLKCCTGYTENQLSPMITIYATLLTNVKTSKYKAAYKNYSRSKRHNFVPLEDILSGDNPCLQSLILKSGTDAN